MEFWASIVSSIASSYSGPPRTRSIVSSDIITSSRLWTPAPISLTLVGSFSILVVVFFCGIVLAHYITIEINSESISFENIIRWIIVVIDSPFEEGK